MVPTIDTTQQPNHSTTNLHLSSTPKPGSGSTASASANGPNPLNLLSSIAHGLSHSNETPKGSPQITPIVRNPPPLAQTLGSSAEMIKVSKTAHLKKMKTATEVVALLCAQTLKLTGPLRKLDVNQAVQALLQQRAKQEEHIGSLDQMARDQLKLMAELQQNASNIKNRRVTTEGQISIAKIEIAKQTDVVEKMKSVFDSMKEAFHCPICQDTSELPLALGICGHIACESCFEEMDDANFMALIKENVEPTSRQHLLARRCPLCRVQVVGLGSTVNPLNDIISAALPIFTAMQTKFVSMEKFKLDIDEAEQSQKQRVQRVYKKPTEQSLQLAALTTGCFAQFQLAQLAVDEMLKKITHEQWVEGTYIIHAPSTSRVFFEIFATTLHGKGLHPDTIPNNNGSIYVLFNNEKRLLVCWFYYWYKDPKSASDKITELELSLKGLAAELAKIAVTPANHDAMKNIRENFNTADAAIVSVKMMLMPSGIPLALETLDKVVKIAIKAEKAIREAVNPPKVAPKTGHTLVRFAADGNISIEVAVPVTFIHSNILGNGSAAAASAFPAPPAGSAALPPPPPPPQQQPPPPTGPAAGSF